MIRSIPVLLVCILLCGAAVAEEAARDVVLSGERRVTGRVMLLEPARLLIETEEGLLEVSGDEVVSIDGREGFALPSADAPARILHLFSIDRDGAASVVGRLRTRNRTGGAVASYVGSLSADAFSDGLGRRLEAKRLEDGRAEIALPSPVPQGGMIEIVARRHLWAYAIESAGGWLATARFVAPERAVYRREMRLPEGATVLWTDPETVVVGDGEGTTVPWRRLLDGGDEFVSRVAYTFAPADSPAFAATKKFYEGLRFYEGGDEAAAAEAFSAALEALPDDPRIAFLAALAGGSPATFEDTFDDGTISPFWRVTNPHAEGMLTIAEGDGALRISGTTSVGQWQRAGIVSGIQVPRPEAEIDLELQTSSTEAECGYNTIVGIQYHDAGLGEHREVSLVSTHGEIYTWIRDDRRGVREGERVRVLEGEEATATHRFGFRCSAADGKVTVLFDGKPVTEVDMVFPWIEVKAGVHSEAPGVAFDTRLRRVAISVDGRPSVTNGEEN